MLTCPAWRMVVVSTLRVAITKRLQAHTTATALQDLAKAKKRKQRKTRIPQAKAKRPKARKINPAANDQAKTKKSNHKKQGDNLTRAPGEAPAKA